METQTLKYLFVEHLPLLQEGFKNGIKYISDRKGFLNFKGTAVKSSDIYNISLAQLIEGTNFHFVWMNMDFPIPSQENHTPLSLLSTIKKNNPKTYILVTIQQATVYSLRRIFQKINPHCILALTDCDQKTISNALNALLQKEVFYSKAILLLLHKFLQTFESMDNADYSILHELDLGTAVTALPEKVFLSHSTILTKRTQLKTLFNLEGKTDAHLVQEVKRLGYI